MQHNAGLEFIVPMGNISGAAIAAGYLGIFSLAFAPLTGLPAIICGVLAIRTLQRDPTKKGWGRAVTGIALGSLFSLMWILIAIGIASN
jgi:hypothetical protein